MGPAMGACYGEGAWLADAPGADVGKALFPFLLGEGALLHAGSQRHSSRRVDSRGPSTEKQSNGRRHAARGSRARRHGEREPPRALAGAQACGEARGVWSEARRGSAAA
jgi:hypothetical protein